MRIAYFDCFSGIAGDMVLGALVGAGVPIDALRDVTRRLGLAEVSLHAESVRRHGLSATRVRVVVDPTTPKKHRHLSNIAAIIDTAGLSPGVAGQAKAVFRRLAEAEAAVHGTSVEKVHFHEVGAADAIVDVVCACAGLAHLGVERCLCSPIPTGQGSVTCEHGVMPVPAPATTLLLQGVPIAATDEPGELATPTGVAIATTLAAEFGGVPAMTLRAVGVGTGAREGKTRPNLLRVLVGDRASGTAGDGDECDTVTVLETHVDDCTGQVLAHACERILQSGALDAYFLPIQMKKGRPGQLLTVLCRPADAERIEALLFAETTTFGIRRHECRRSKLARERVAVATRFGPIRVKVGRRGGAVVQAWPETDDCVAAARGAGASLREVQQEALRRWAERDHDAGDGNPPGEPLAHPPGSGPG